MFLGGDQELTLPKSSHGTGESLFAFLMKRRLIIKSSTRFLSETIPGFPGGEG
jgi:hypothetical protein